MIFIIPAVRLPLACDDGRHNDRGILMVLHLLLVLVGAVPHRERNERGATGVEYALIAGLCVLAFVGGVEALKLALGAFFNGTQASLDKSVP